MGTFKASCLAGVLAGAALMAPAVLRAAPADGIVGGDTSVAPAAGLRFDRAGDPGAWVTASASLFEAKHAFGLSSQIIGKGEAALLHPYLRSIPYRSGLHRQVEAGLTLPLDDGLALATAYRRVRLRGALPATYAVNTQFAKVGLKFDF